MAASFNRLLDEKVGSIYRGLYASLGTAKAVGEDTVEFHLAEPNGHILMLLANTAASIVNVKAVQADRRRVRPQAGRQWALYGGASSSAARASASCRTRLCGRLPRDPKGDRVHGRAGGRLTHGASETGGVDVVERVPPESMPAINALKHAKVINPPSMFSINMEMVLRGSARRTQRVRKALNLAIDREGMAKGILGGLGTPSVGMVGPGTQDELRRTFPPIAFDPEGAKKLLAEAGYKPGSLSLTLTCPNGRYIKDAQVCQAIAGSFENIGDQGDRERRRPRHLEQDHRHGSGSAAPTTWGW